MPYRDSPHHESEILMSLDFLSLVRPNKHKKDYHIRKPNDKKLLFESEDKEYIYVGQKLVSFETSDKKVQYSSEIGFNVIKYRFLTVRKTITLRFIEKKSLLKSIKVRQKKMSRNICTIKMMN